MKGYQWEKRNTLPFKNPIRLTGDFSSEIIEISENWLASSKYNTNKKPVNLKLYITKYYKICEKYMKKLTY